jgi:protein-S-isoprenylcysteine O-methyltransferase Ste14
VRGKGRRRRMSASDSEKEGFLTRSRLRDTVFVLSLACALFLDVGSVEVAAAFLLLALGSFIHFVTKGVLIRNEVLCKDGIYHVVRHPYYLANFLVDSCFCVLSGSQYVILLYTFLFFWSYGPTMRSEERNLARRYPAAFADYALDTPRVFPDRTSIRNLGSLFAGFSIKRISPKELARIVRFWAMAAFILLARGVSEAGPLGMGIFKQPSLDLLLTSVILLLAASVVILRVGKGRNSGTTENLSS